MRYAQIRACDISNGVGIRTSLYVQGCSRQCKGCFNPETWDFEGGKSWDSQIESQFLELIGKPHIVGVTILGGEPLANENREEVTRLTRKISEKYPEKSIWLYTSYTYEELEGESILDYVDVIVDGPFIEEKKDFSLKFRGSDNQRVICVKQTKKEGVLCLYNC